MLKIQIAISVNNFPSNIYSFDTNFKADENTDTFNFINIDNIVTFLPFKNTYT